MKNEDISKLVLAVQNKEKDAFEILYEEIWDTAFYYCRKQLGNIHDAEDAAQDVIVRVYRSIDNLRSPQAFNKFLSQIMARVCINTLRKKRAASEETDPYDNEEITESIPEDNIAFLPEGAVLSKEQKEQLMELVEKLPEKQREAILLYYFNELTQVEIGEVTNSKENAVNNRLVTARKTLRMQFEALFQKGKYEYTMAATPILTKLFHEECGEMCTAEVKDRIWQGVAKEIGLSPNVSGKSQPGNTAANAAGKATGALKPLNAALIGLASAAVVAGGALGASVYRDHTAVPAPTVAEAGEESIDDIIAALKKVKSPSEFAVFCAAYGFASMETEYHEEGLYEMSVRTIQGQQLFVGSRETEAGEFAVAYEIADAAAGRPERIRDWFARSSEANNTQ
ncbi:MAG: sigma-70 family RNA polymerase sigma factor [Oscillospiraceae bacterium]|nr:sigma-70 family RNA polymerase sigma factor [Oscillospiraceae bacterium]